MARHFYFHASVKVISGDGVARQHVFRHALIHHFAPFTACLGANVNDIVGSQHHILVVFHNDDRVAKVSQFFKRGYQPFVITLVQTNTWLVEDVKHVNQLRTNLRGESDALAFATRKRYRLTVKREII